MSSYSMADIAGLLGTSGTAEVKNSTSRKNNTELNMEDFLQLMIVQLQNQTIDDTMDTSEMMNQMVQMQMITAISNMTETSIMSYASSLVGKVVTVGVLSGDSLEEREVLVTGTGVLNGSQVIFGKDDKGNVETYSLSQIMAIGQLPPVEETPGESEDSGDEAGKPVEGVEKPGESTEKPGEGGEAGGVTAPEASVGGSEAGDTQYEGEQGAPTD